MWGAGRASTLGLLREPGSRNHGASSLASVYFLSNYKLCVWGTLYTSADVCREQKRVWDHPELELQVVVSHSTWVLETKLKSSIRTASALNC